MGGHPSAAQAWSKTRDEWILTFFNDEKTGCGWRCRQGDRESKGAPSRVREGIRDSAGDAAGDRPFPRHDQGEHGVSARAFARLRT